MTLNRPVWMNSVAFDIRAFELTLTGRDAAERIGLVSRRVPGAQLLDTCHEMAERLTTGYRVDQAHAVEWTGRRKPGRTHAGGRPGQTLRTPAHLRLRGSGGCACREPGPPSDEK